MDAFWKDSEKTILIQVFPEQWSWEEYWISVHKMKQMLQEVNHDVFLIIDCRCVKSVPRGTLSYFHEASKNMVPHVVLRIFLAPHRVLRTLITILIKIVPGNFQNFICASSMEEAYRLITQAQQSTEKLPDSGCQ